MDFISSQFDTNGSDDVFACPTPWSGLLYALAQTSPVCALLHPSENLVDLLCTIESKDITTDVNAMEMLQKEIPLLFSFFRHLKYTHSSILLPIVKTMILKSKAPFALNSSSTSISSLHSSQPPHESELSYFPSLPKVRQRGYYTADKTNPKEKLCTKQSYGHPTLLPGIFTLFCEHG